MLNKGRNYRQVSPTVKGNKGSLLTIAIDEGVEPLR